MSAKSCICSVSVCKVYVINCARTFYLKLKSIEYVEICCLWQEHFGSDQWTRRAHKLKANAVPGKFKLCISKYCEDAVLFQSKEAKLVGHRTKSAPPCCLCFNRLSESGVVLNSSDGSSHPKQGCLLQQYYNEHDDQKQLKIMEYARHRNVELREQIAALQAKLISLGAF